ncbi:MAG TPA: ABC transporter ATP-binding protein [Geobacteraceae bacterium]
MTPAIILHNITKRYGVLTAVEDFSLEVERGLIFGLLGPNGAGKTTLIKILTTLLSPTSGEASVEGRSVLAEAKEVRRLIGVVPQENNLDRYLTARENLVLHARMHGMRPAEYNAVIDELLELTGLSGRQHDFPDTYSGGMQRRLVVARALVHHPRVLILDEPTTGLDPQSRRAVWDYIQTLRAKMTIFLTTHYMDEADTLCDRIVIMDHGKTLVDGTSAQLKEALAHSHLYELEFRANADRYETLLRGLPFVQSTERSGNLFRLSLTGEEALKPLMDAIGSADIRKICLREPSLEDVFIELTGKKVRE